MNASARGSLPLLGRFAALAFAISWLCWLPAVFARQNVVNTSFAGLYFLGGCGPSLAGLYLAYRQGGWGGVKTLVRRALELRFAPRWWAAILLVWPLLFGLAAGLASLAGSSPYPYSALGKVVEAQPWLLLPLALLSLASGALAEEYGWRGTAQAPLEALLGRAGASLALGLAWGLWQLPLFWMVGTLQSNLSPPLYLLSVLAAAFVFTWVYDGTGRSLGAAVLLRFALNLALLFVPLLDPLTLAALAGIEALAALGLGIRWLTHPR